MSRPGMAASFGAAAPGAPHAGAMPFAAPPPSGAPVPGLPAPHPGYGRPWAPKPPKTAAQQLGIVGCVVLFVLAAASLAAASFFSLAVSALSVPLVFAGLRLAGKQPRPLPFFCYGYAIALAAWAILGTVVVIVEPASTDASDLLVPGICAGVAIVLAVIPLTVRAVREGKRPPAVR